MAIDSNTSVDLLGVAADSNTWVDLFGTLAATFIGAWLGYLLAGKQERDRDTKVRRSLREALVTEVEMCASLANTYLESNIVAPAYRFPRSVYEVSFPQLVASGVFPSQSVGALIAFYSQVAQINWCLDEVHKHVQSLDHIQKEIEVNRLVAKCKELSSPNSRFYNPAIESLREAVIG